MTRPSTRIRAASVLVVAIALSAVWAAALGLYGDGSVYRGYWLLKTRVLGPEEVGIWRPDPVLGWEHQPNSVGRQRNPPDYDASYHIDERGNRLTAASYALPQVIFLGDSFTFGHGVEDGEPYPARLQALLPSYKIVNAAVNGWGTGHAMLRLKEELEQDQPIKLVVYGFIGQDVQRNSLRRTWLRMLHESRGRRNPYFTIVDGEPVFQGLAAHEKQGLPDSPELRQTEEQMTLAMLRSMAERCRGKGIPLVVAYLPDGTSDEQLASKIATALGDAGSLVDLRKKVDHASHHFAHEQHLTADGHRLVAEALYPEIAKRLGH